MKLTSKQKAQIRKEANKIKASFQIGAQEVHRSNILAIRESFNTKEILKVKVNRANKEDKNITKELASLLEKEIAGSQVAGIVGTTIILYREHEDVEQRMKLN